MFLSMLLLMASPYGIASEEMPSIESSVIGGTDAPKGRYPYNVSLTKHGKHACGASLIAPDIILCAAHCFTSSPDPLISTRYRVGLSSMWDTVVEHVPKYVINHPYFNSQTYSHDQTIIQIRNKSHEDPVKVDLNWIDSENGEKVTVIGFGRTTPEKGSPPPDDLQHVDLHLFPTDSCIDRYTAVNPVDDSMICTFEDGKDACQGDSGGPLIRKGDDPSGADDVQVGIVSWGWGCATDYPGVYSRTSVLLPKNGRSWIRERVCELSVNPPHYFNCKCRNSSTDNWTHEYENGTTIGCDFIQNNPDSCNLVGTGKFTAWEACPVACDTCPDEEEEDEGTCADNTDWTFYRANKGTYKKCAFINGKKEKFKKKVCRKRWQMTLRADQGCPLTCRKCPKRVGCVDNKSWKSIITGMMINPYKCSDLKKLDKTTREQLCNTMEGKIQKLGKDACPKSCGTCCDPETQECDCDEEDEECEKSSESESESDSEEESESESEEECDEEDEECEEE